MSEAIGRQQGISWKHIGTWGFFLSHLMPVLAVVTGIRWHVWIVLGGLYVVRMFFVTAGYHRYFAHRTFRLNRFWQFWLAFFAQTSAQKGVLWWAGHHRMHHQFSDTDRDAHSPNRGFWWSHAGWLLSKEHKRTPIEFVEDFARYPELRLLDRFHMVPAILLGLTIFLTLGADALFMGFFLSTVLVWHGTFFINSLAHVFGRRRYVTNDSSRNSFLLALITLGEGWHNNHHHFPGTARQGFFWWEVDVTYYVLKVLSWLGIVRQLRPLPQKVRRLWLVRDGYFDIGMFENRLARAAAVLGRARGKTGERIGYGTDLVTEFIRNAHEQAGAIVQTTARSALRNVTRRQTT